MNSKSSWHVWVMTNNRHHQVIDFLSEADGVEDFLYPSVDKEYKTKNGKSVIKTIPLYANYIFIKYMYSAYLQTELNKCPWLTTYVGLCSHEELLSIKEMNGMGYEALLSSVDDIKPGMVVKMNNGGFKDMLATVVSVDGGRVTVSIKLFGEDRMVKCYVDDVVKQ